MDFFNSLSPNSDQHQISPCNLDQCLFKPLKSSELHPVTHYAILYADRRERRKSPSVPGAAIAVFADRLNRRHLTCQISAIKFAGIRQLCPFPRFLRSSLQIASKVNQSIWAILSHDFSKRPSMEPGNKVEVPHRRLKKIAKCVRINR